MDQNRPIAQSSVQPLEQKLLSDLGLLQESVLMRYAKQLQQHEADHAMRIASNMLEQVVAMLLRNLGPRGHAPSAALLEALFTRPQDETSDLEGALVKSKINV